jgi:hypothetical protein
VNKDHQPGFGLLVDDEYSRAEPVHRSLDTGLGVQISWLARQELLAGVGKLAGHERFASAGLHYYANRHPMIPRGMPRCAQTIFSHDRRTELRWIMVLGQALHFHAP